MENLRSDTRKGKATDVQAEAVQPAGTFNPAMPKDTHEVLRLFAIAARASCAAPETLSGTNARLLEVIDRLVAPELQAAQECLKLWRLFAKVAQLPKESLRQEAGHAFFRDLDALGQRLDLPPLDDWDQIPQSVDDPNATLPKAGAPATATLASAKVQAKEIKAGLAPGTPFPPDITAELIASLGPNDRRQAFDQMVGAGVLGRSEVNLLIRFLLKGDKLTRTDSLLTEVLQRMGAHMAQ